MRYKITISYHGADFFGWQYQPDKISVQGILEEKLAILNGAPIQIWGCGRTDSGVHALGQVAHFDYDGALPAYKLQASLNGMVKPHRVAITEITPIDSEFHARFSAKMRHYIYRVWAHQSPPILCADFVWFVPHQLNTNAIKTASQFLIGTHNFQSFRAKNCQALSPIKTLNRLDIDFDGKEIKFSLSAKSFLYHQVRNIIGTLIDIGKGRWQASAIKEMLDAQNRAAAGPTAPPHGLCFQGVDYD